MQLLADNPLLVLVCFGLCWPSPVAVIVTFILARRYDWRNPLVSKSSTTSDLEV